MSRDLQQKTVRHVSVTRFATGPDGAFYAETIAGNWIQIDREMHGNHSIATYSEVDPTTKSEVHVLPAAEFLDGKLPITFVDPEF